MTDGTRPTEAENPAAVPPPVPPTPPYAAPPPYDTSRPPYAASPPPYVAAQPQQAPPLPYAAQVPPYAAGSPYAAPVAPAGYSTGPRQEYPGAPPTWGPAAGAPWQQAAPPVRSGSSILAILALSASILGVLIGFIPFVGAFFAWVLLIAAVVLAIISLVRRMPGKGMSIAAIIVSVLGFGISLVWAAFTFLLGGLSSFIDIPDQDPYPEAYTYPSLSAPEFGAEGTPIDDPLIVGDSVTLFDETAGEDVWEMTVGPFEDATEATMETPADAPVYGAIIAVPIELTNVSDEALSLEIDDTLVPYAWFLTGQGDVAETEYLRNNDAYPDVWATRTVDPGETVTYYELFDAAPGDATAGAFVIELDSGQSVVWATEPSDPTA